jgi:hypothetical protein
MLHLCNSQAVGWVQQSEMLCRKRKSLPAFESFDTLRLGKGLATRLCTSKAAGTRQLWPSLVTEALAIHHCVLPVLSELCPTVHSSWR